MAKRINIKDTIKKSYLKKKISQSEIENFETALKAFQKNTNENESEDAVAGV